MSPLPSHVGTELCLSSTLLFYISEPQFLHLQKGYHIFLSAEPKWGGEEKGAVQVWVPDWLGKREVLLGSSIDSTRITDLTEE